MVIEIVDAEEKIEAFLPTLETMVGDGFVTLEKVRVVKYRQWVVSIAPSAARSGTESLPRARLYAEALT